MHEKCTHIAAHVRVLALLDRLAVGGQACGPAAPATGVTLLRTLRVVQPQLGAGNAVAVLAAAVVPPIDVHLLVNVVLGPKSDIWEVGKGEAVLRWVRNNCKLDDGVKILVHFCPLPTKTTCLLELSSSFHSV